MKNFFLFLFFILVCLKLFSQTHFTEARPNSDKSNTVIDFNSPDTAILNYLIFCFTNKEREKRKIPPLTYSSELAQSAQYHTGQMVEHGFFSHNNPKDSLLRFPTQRIRHFGYNPQDCTGENIIKTIPFDCHEKTKLKSERKQGLYVYYKQSIFGKKTFKAAHIYPTGKKNGLPVDALKRPPAKYPQPQFPLHRHWGGIFR